MYQTSELNIVYERFVGGSVAVSRQETSVFSQDEYAEGLVSMRTDSSHRRRHDALTFSKTQRLAAYAKYAGCCLNLMWLALVFGCAVNPVTGHRELSLLSTADEISMGQRQYGAIQQLSGGEYRVDPGVAKYVAVVGQRVARHSDRALPYEFVVVNDSTPNAWALPGGKIGIHRGLLVELENEAELAAVLGHEIVHAAAKHSANQIQRDVLLGLTGLGIAYAVDDHEHAREIVAATNVGLHLAGRKFDRNQERLADHHGMKYMHLAGYDTSAAVSLQEKFVAMKHGRRSDWLTGLFATHPPSQERVKHNRAALLEFPPGGDLGEAHFRAQMRTLLDDREAYALADEARASEDVAQSLALINQAIDLQPRESLFHGIRGDIFASQGRHQDAVQSFTVATALNNSYFAPYLARGMSFDALGDVQRARNDFQVSNRLFQTSLASFKLGQYALAAGDRNEAKRKFELASKDEGYMGKTALNAYVKMDIEDEPWDYVDVESFFENGQIVVKLTNSSGYVIKDIVVRVIAKIDGKEVTRQLGLRRLESGYYEILNSAIDYRSEDEVRVRARILSAAPGW